MSNIGLLVRGRFTSCYVCVGAIYSVKKPRKVFTALEHLQLGQVRVTFDGRSQAVFSTHDSLSRELKPMLDVLGKDSRHEMLAPWTFSPPLDRHVLKLQIDLKNHESEGGDEDG